MNRTLRTAGLAAGALALGLIASACSSVVTDAATVNSSSIRQRDFEAQLQAFANNAAYQSTVSDQGGPSVLGPGGKGTVSMEFTGRVLGLDIQFELLRQEADERDIIPTAVHRQRAEEQAKAFFAPAEQADVVWNAFPASFRDDLAKDLSYVIALQEAVGSAAALDDAALRKVYDEDPDRFGLLCAQHILLETEAEAEDVLTQLEAGADFAELATSTSTDPSAAENAGKLYEGDECPTAAATFDGDFVTGALSVPVGQLTRPVKTQFGYHVILVDKLTVQPFDDVKDAVEQYATQRASTAFSDLLSEAAKGDITVNPRYGSWDAATLEVVPPGSSPSTTAAPNG